MQEKSIKIMLVIVIAVLLISNVSLSRRLSNLENELRNITHNVIFSQPHEFNSLHNMMWEVSQDVNTLRDQISQSTSLSFNETARIQSYDSQNATANVQISFYLREHNPADTVSLTATSASAQYNSVATFANGRFTANMWLPVRENYSIVFTTDGDTITTGHLMQFNLADRLCQRFVFWVNQGSSSYFGGRGNEPTRHSISIAPHLQNRTYGDDMLELALVFLHIESDGQRIRTFDLTEYLHTVGDVQELQHNWFEFEVGDEPGQINPGGYVLMHLIMYDNLRIRYEQTNVLHVPHYDGRPMREPYMHRQGFGVTVIAN